MDAAHVAETPDGMSAELARLRTAVAELKGVADQLLSDDADDDLHAWIALRGWRDAAADLAKRPEDRSPAEVQEEITKIALHLRRLARIDGGVHGEQMHELADRVTALQDLIPLISDGQVDVVNEDEDVDLAAVAGLLRVALADLGTAAVEVRAGNHKSAGVDVHISCPDTSTAFLYAGFFARLPDLNPATEATVVRFTILPAVASVHGRQAGYKQHQCEGPLCRAAFRTSKHDRRSQQRRARLDAAPRIVKDDGSVVSIVGVRGQPREILHGHGNTYTYWGCRCEVCTTTTSARRRELNNGPKVTARGGADPEDEWWTTLDVANYLRVTVSTVSSYRARGQIPPPDETIGRTHVWKPQRIIDWHASRPGHGGRPPVRPAE